MFGNIQQKQSVYALLSLEELYKSGKTPSYLDIRAGLCYNKLKGIKEGLQH